MAFFLFLLVPFTALAQSYDVTQIVSCSLKLAQKISQENVLRTRITTAETIGQLYPGLVASVSPTAVHTPSSDTNGNYLSISVEQKIFDAQIFSQLDANRSAIKSARFDLVQNAFQESNLALEDLSQIRSLQNQKDLFESLLQSYDLSEQIMSTGSRLGVSDSNDLLQLRAQIRLVKTQINQTQFEIERRKDVFLSRYGYQPVPLTDIKLLEKETTVIASRLPGALALAAAAEQAHFEKMVIDRRLWPQLSLRGTYNGVHSEHPNTLSYPQSSASISLQIDLSNWWREREQRSLQQPLINVRKHRLGYNIQNLETEYQQVDQELSLLNDQVPLLAERLEFARKSKEVSRAKLRLGRLSFLELQQVEQAAFSAANDIFTVNLRLHLLKLRKELAVNFEPQNIKQISCLL